MNTGIENNNTKQCPYCGETIMANAVKCKHCGEWLDESKKNNSVESSADSLQTYPQANQSMAQPIQPTQNTVQPQIIINQPSHQTNGLGIAGFVLSLLSTLGCWVPGLNICLLIIALLFSLVGLLKRPRGLAIAGFVISALDFILIYVVLKFIGSILNL